MEKVVTHSAEETKKYAKRFAGKLRGGEVVLLYGDLGTGKTTFVQGLAEALGYRDVVQSPTFVLRRFYQGHFGVAHYDFYRLESNKELEVLDINEDIGDETIVVIEWPDKVDFNFDGAKKIYFKDLGKDARQITNEDLA